MCVWPRACVLRVWGEGKVTEGWLMHPRCTPLLMCMYACAYVDVCVPPHQAGGQGHILNLGHGVTKETPEEAVKLFIDTAKAIPLEKLRAAGKPASRLAGVGV